jgi:hypothetical protein
MLNPSFFCIIEISFLKGKEIAPRLSTAPRSGAAGEIPPPRQIMQNTHKFNAKFIQSFAKFMQKFIQSLHKVYTKFMQNHN